MPEYDNLTLIPKPEMERLRNLTGPRDSVISIFADACRINTLYMISCAGSGHVGSSLSAMDLVALLHLDVMSKPGADAGDIYFSSKGHDVPGLYAVLMGLGLLPFEQIHCLRRLEGLPGHPDVGTPHIATNTGSLGMGIAKAKGMISADRLAGRARRYYVLLGDGELQEGQFWESLQPTANGKFGEMTAIVDHNKLQSDTFLEQVSDLGDLEARVRAHGWAVERCDGHDPGAIRAALEALQSHTDRPGLLIADTIKGAGAGKMESTHFRPEDRLYAYHSGAPAPDVYAETVALILERLNEALAALGETPIEPDSTPRPAKQQPVNPQRLVGAYSEALVKAGEEHDELVVLDADLALDCGLLKFEERWPDRFFECGIAEQDMVSQAGGLALQGCLPVGHSFACFLSTRPNEQIYNNATEHTKIIYVGSLAGLIPGGTGHSHQSVRDISALAAMPDMLLIEPSCEREVFMAMDYLVNEHPSSAYMRLVPLPYDIAYELPREYVLEPGKGVVLTQGQDVALFAYGPVMLTEAVKAANTLREKGIGVQVINLPWLNRFDDAWLAEAVEDFERIVTLDDHYLTGGQGEMLIAAMARCGLLNHRRIRQFGVTEIPQCGQNDEVLAAHRLNAESLSEDIATFLREG